MRLRKHLETLIEYTPAVVFGTLFCVMIYFNYTDYAPMVATVIVGVIFVVAILAILLRRRHPNEILSSRKLDKVNKSVLEKFSILASSAKLLIIKGNKVKEIDRYDLHYFALPKANGFEATLSFDHTRKNIRLAIFDQFNINAGTLKAKSCIQVDRWKNIHGVSKTDRMTFVRLLEHARVIRKTMPRQGITLTILDEDEVWRMVLVGNTEFVREYGVN